MLAHYGTLPYTLTLNPLSTWIQKMRQVKKNIRLIRHQEMPQVINTLRPRQNGRHFADDTFKRIFLNENVRISIKISLTFVPEGPINNISALVQIMAWRRPGDKPLSEPMMTSLPTHICVTRPQWVNSLTNVMRTRTLFTNSFIIVTDDDQRHLRWRSKKAPVCVTR